MSCENLLTVSNQDMEVITSLVCSCYGILMMVAKISGLKAHPCGGWLLAWAILAVLCMWRFLGTFEILCLCACDEFRVQECQVRM
jgi:hypothetical protein